MPRCVCVRVRARVHYMCPGALGGQKRALDPLELELQVVVSGYVGPGN